MSGLTYPLPLEQIKRRVSEHAQTDKGLVRMAFYADVAWVCQFFGASVVGGPRTDKRNAAIPGSSGDSKHTERGGWGCAADLWFDLAHQREAAREALHDLGWHTYVGDDYAPQRLHVQAFAYGVKPEKTSLGPPLGSVAGSKGVEMETKSERNATKPGIGSLRDALIGAFAGWAGAQAAAATGSPEVGDVAAQQAAQVGPEVVGIAAGAIMGGLTWIRKRVTDWRAGL